jgi:hypothetical protein
MTEVLSRYIPDLNLPNYEVVSFIADIIMIFVPGSIDFSAKIE